MKPKRIVIIGEALVDQFPDGTSVIGGAPLNVAWHVRGLGRAEDAPWFVSAVGQDDLGDQIISTLENWGLAIDHIQVCKDKPTGTVQVVLDNGQPSYTLVDEVAYDHIAIDTNLIARLGGSGDGDGEPPQRPLLYHGSLCFRSATTKRTILQLRQQLNADVFVDINIREGHYDDGWADELLSGARYLKCNEHELARLTRRSIATHDSVLQATRSLIEQFGLMACWITMGANGAFWIDHRGDHFFRESPSVPADRFKDTIGAGDAFTAVVLRGIAHNRYPAEALDDAIQFAAKVCTISGATTQDQQLY